MPPGPRSIASWERVLAAMEAEAARAQALLVSDDAAATGGIEYDGQDGPTAPTPSDEPPNVPATWRLPTATGAARASGLSPEAAARAKAGYAEASLAGAGVGARAGVGVGAVAGAVAGASVAAGASPASTLAEPAPHSDPHATGSAAPADADTAAITLGVVRATDAPFDLPDPADMPPMEPEQLARFEALRDRIAQLQSELSSAISEVETVLGRSMPRRPTPPAAPRPELVDRRL